MTNERPGELGSSEGTTVTAMSAAYAAAGFDSSLSVPVDARIVCRSCSQVSPAGPVTMSSLRRMEGESDPADMVADVAITCPHCGQRATLVSGFGPAVAAEDANDLRELIDKREDDRLPGDTAPGEEATTTPTIVPREDPISAEDRQIMRKHLDEFIRRHGDSPRVLSSDDPRVATPPIDDSVN